MRRFQSIDRSHRVLKRAASYRQPARLLLCDPGKSSWTRTIFAAIRRGSSMNWATSGPDLDAICMLFDWLLTGQVVATHVVRAQRSLNLGQKPPHDMRYVSRQNS